MSTTPRKRATGKAVSAAAAKPARAKRGTAGKQAGGQTPVLADAGPVVGESALVLDSRLGIAEAGSLHEALKRVTEAGQPLRLEASQVEAIDTAVLQLLVVHARERQTGGGAPQWLGVSPVLRDAARLLGLERHLQLPV